MMMDINNNAASSTALVCVTLGILPISLWILWRQQQRQQQGKSKSGASIPNAVGGSALLGNALQYKENPTQCIRDQQLLTGSKIFRINLAGRKMIIVGSDVGLMKQVATQRKSVMSSCRAVAEIGFEYTLGGFNVYKGTAWHKQILKNYIMGNNFVTNFLPSIYRGLLKAMEMEIQFLLQKQEEKTSVGVQVGGPDLFVFSRRCVLRAILDEFVSPILLQKDPELLTTLMKFQDGLEDATAASAVLPRFLALPLYLWPTKKARISIQQRIAQLLPEIWNNDNHHHWGPWAKAYHEEGTSPEQAAEHLVGLIFAAHKNPSIGAAQSFCFLRTELTQHEQTQAQQEAKLLCEQFTTASGTTTSSLVDALLQAQTLRNCVLETMRLTAHTLGAVRYANQDLEIQSSEKSSHQNYTIAEGETVSLAHHAMHMETSIWGNNPQAFVLDRPEWNNNNNNNKQEEEEEGAAAATNSNSSFGIPVDHYKLTTFSNGTHKCPGETVALAIMEIQLAIMLVQETQLMLTDGNKDKLAPISFERATLAQRDGPVPFTIQQQPTK